MANFTTETAVRDKFQTTDTTLIPSGLVTQSITDAHTEIIRYLDPIFDTSPTDDGVVLGETLLAGAHLLRSLSSKEAVEQKRVSVGSARIETGPRHKALTEQADTAERRAWSTLEIYLLELPPQIILSPTISTPVLGEE